MGHKFIKKGAKVKYNSKWLPKNVDDYYFDVFSSSRMRVLEGIILDTNPAITTSYPGAIRVQWKYYSQNQKQPSTCHYFMKAEQLLPLHPLEEDQEYKELFV